MNTHKELPLWDIPTVISGELMEILSRRLQGAAPRGFGSFSRTLHSRKSATDSSLETVNGCNPPVWLDLAEIHENTVQETKMLSVSFWVGW